MLQKSRKILFGHKFYEYLYQKAKGTKRGQKIKSQLGSQVARGSKTRGNRRFPSSLQQGRSFQAGGYQQSRFWYGQGREQEGPVLQLEEAKAHPEEGMDLPLAFMDVLNVKDSVGKVESPKMVSSVPMVGIPTGRELGSCGTVLSCRESIQVSRELGLRDIHPALPALNLSLISEGGLPSTGRLRFFLGNWRAVTNYREVLSMVQGLRIDWISQPFQLRMPRPPVFSSREQSLIANELDSLLKKGAVIPVDWCDRQFLSHIFLVPKKGGTFRPVFNLKRLNAFVRYEHFKMESTPMLMNLIQRG